ncbi:MAG: MBL fold metallo-hydrolase [Rikenellaceae bacterium]
MISVHTIVNTVYNSNTFILYHDHSDYVWIVDCGDIDPIVEWLGKNHKTVKGVLLTHTHHDHIYGLNDLYDLFPKLEVYTSEHGASGLKNTTSNLSKYTINPFIYKGDKIMILDNGSELELFSNYTISVYYTSGHDISSLTYKLDNFLFTGDSYIPNVKVVTSFPLGDREANKESLKLIDSLITSDTIICAGHTIN